MLSIYRLVTFSNSMTEAGLRGNVTARPNSWSTPSAAAGCYACDSRSLGEFFFCDRILMEIPQ